MAARLWTDFLDEDEPAGRADVSLELVPADEADVAAQECLLLGLIWGCVRERGAVYPVEQLRRLLREFSRAEFDSSLGALLAGGILVCRQVEGAAVVALA